MNHLQPTDYQRQIQSATTYDRALDVAAVLGHQFVRQMQHAARTLFWFGAALSRAESLATQKKMFYATASDEIGLPASTLRLAINWYDLHGGKYELLEDHIADDPSLTQSEMRLLVSQRSEQVKAQREHRRYEDRMQAAGREPTLPRPEPQPVSLEVSDAERKTSMSASMTKLERRQIKAHIEAQGKSVSTWIYEAITEKMERESAPPDPRRTNGTCEHGVPVTEEAA